MNPPLHESARGAVLGPGELSIGGDAVLRAAPVTFGRIDWPSDPQERTRRVQTVLSRARSAVETFDRLTRRSGAPPLRIGYAPFDSELQVGAAAPGNLRLIEATAPIRIADVWYAESHRLRFRLEKTEHALTGAVSLRFYQLDGQGDDAEAADLRLLSESAFDLTDLAFASADLINPLEPLLIVALTHDDRLLAVDLLAFPSLCRGGLHSSELEAAVSTGDYLLDLQSLADGFTMALLERSSASASIPRIVEVDTVDALGSEPIFRGDVASWLDRIFNVRLHSTRSRAPTGTRDACHQLFPALPYSLAGEVEDVLIRLPARALPTISLLVDSGDEPTAAEFVPPYLVADATTNQGRWYVGLPPAEPWLHDLQIRAGRLEFPPRLSGGKASASCRPAAILFTNPPKSDDHSRTFPISRDSPQPIFTRELAPDQSELPVTVVVHTISDSDALDRALRSLSKQSVAKSSSIVLFDPFSAAADAFGSPRSVASTPELLQLLGDQASEADRLLLFVNSAVTLHDDRTAGVLARMAALPRVASAGCLLIDAKFGPKSAMEFRSAGLFPDRIEFLAHPAIVLSQPNCEECLPRMTYPVAGNSLDLLMARASTWVELMSEPGVRSAHPFAVAQALDYATSSLRRHHIHLCTTLVSAFHGGVKAQATFTGLPVRDAVPYRDLVDCLDEVTIIRRL